jgi:hypothetical protein
MMILNKFQKLKQKNRYMNNKERIQKVILTFFQNLIVLKQLSSKS